MTRPRGTVRLDLIEVTLVVALASFMSWHASAWVGVHPEEAYFRSLYGTLLGPGRYSEHEEEWLIRHFFDDKRDGIFVDVGANDYRTFSNTYFLEAELGWSGVAIEPLRQFEADYATYRPNTRFLPFFVSDQSDSEAKMYLIENHPLVTSADKGFTTQWSTDVVEVSAPTATLDDLLDAEGISRIDLLNMDIELSEPAALAGFDIERFRPALVCIEAHLKVRQQILNYFARHGYVLVGAYLRVDTQNLYFAPLTAAS